MSDLTLTAQPRTLIGRKVRQLRRQGLVPVVVYGKKQKDAESLQVSSRRFERVLHQAGFSQLVKLDVEGGKTHNVLIRDVQRHPVTRNFLHVDFYAVDLTEKQQIGIPVNRTGSTEAMAAGLMVLQALDQVTVEALPADIPANIEVDISALTLENSITVADLPEIEGVVYLNEPDEAVFTLLITREEEEEEAPIADEGAEPELVSRGDQEEDGEE